MDHHPSSSHFFSCGNSIVARTKKWSPVILLLGLWFSNNPPLADLRWEAVGGGLLEFSDAPGGWEYYPGYHFRSYWKGWEEDSAPTCQKNDTCPSAQPAAVGEKSRGVSTTPGCCSTTEVSLRLQIRKRRILFLPSWAPLTAAGDSSSVGNNTHHHSVVVSGADQLSVEWASDDLLDVGNGSGGALELCLQRRLDDVVIGGSPSSFWLTEEEPLFVVPRRPSPPRTETGSYMNVSSPNVPGGLIHTTGFTMSDLVPGLCR